MAETADLGSGQRPLKGTVLCCTSVTQDVRTKVAEAASQMGAVHNLDLTAEVTHLIVGSVTTPKYRYVAKERPDIAVLHPDWIDAVRSSWMQGGDVDVAQLEKDHRLRTFFGLKICVTGFADMDQRNFISSTIEDEGAEYHGDLTKQVTHLIVASPAGAKYAAAKQWGISIVSLRWFEESLQRGMALDESLYDPLLPREEQGKGAFRAEARTRTSLGKRTRGGETQAAAGDDAGKRKLRRTASSRLNSQSQDLWQDISAREGDAEQSKPDQWTDEGARQKGPLAVERPMTPLFPNKPSEKLQEPDNLFAGRHILIHGFDDEKVKKLHKYLLPNGASIATSVAALEKASRHPPFKARYILVPHFLDCAPANLPDLPARTILATEWWVERCIQAKAVLDPADDVLCCPLFDFPADIFAELKISSTGLSGVDLRQMAQAVKLTGATYLENLVPSVHVLVNGPGGENKAKAYYAIRHSIPLVSPDWLRACLRTKLKVPFDRYLVNLPSLDPAEVFLDLSNTNQNTNRSRESRTVYEPSRTSTSARTPTTSLPSKAQNPIPRAAGPFIDDDDENDDKNDDGPTQCNRPPAPEDDRASPKALQPLNDISPNVSPRKNSHYKDDDDDEDNSHETERKRTPVSLKSSPPASATSPDKPPLVPKEPPALEERTAKRTEELTANLASLLNRTVGSNPVLDASPTKKRKNRPLGRNLSGIAASHRSASPALSTDAHAPADGFTPQAIEEPLPPSTQLTYETPGQEQHRLDVEKKMKVRLSDGARIDRVPSVGTVTDAGGRAESNRSRVRSRAK